MDVAAIAPVFVHASDKRRKNVWHSIGNGNWSDPNIWMSNALSIRSNYNYPGQRVAAPIFPEVGDDVYVNHTVTFNVSSNSVPILVNSLYISGKLTCDNGDRHLVLYGDMQCTGIVDFSPNTNRMILALNGVNNFIQSFIPGLAASINYSRQGESSIMDLSYRAISLSSVGVKNISQDCIAKKYLISNLTILGNVLLSGFSTVSQTTFELENFDLTVNGAFSVSSGAKVKKSSGGSMVFIGLVTTNGGWDLSGGNPIVELRSGISFSGNPTMFLSGLGSFNFTTNNQNINITSGTPIQFDCPVLVVGSISVTNTNLGNGMQVNHSLNGTSGGSTFINTGVLIINTTTPLMTTGVLDITSPTNRINYAMGSNFTLPYTLYQGLIISGAGTKTLGGNTVLGASLAISGAATLELSSFDLTINTTSSINGNLLKNSSGHILFIGLATFSGAGSNTNLSGNPTIEFRGGISANLSASQFLIGTGLISFTTNNQSVSGSSSLIIYNDILVSGAIVLSFTGGAYVLHGAINGNNALSKFDNRLSGAGAQLSYQSPVEPMITGVLECNAAANTFKYNAAGNQDVKGTTYRTLEFGGSGVKKLMGNVVVNTTAGGSWSITGTATIDYNGFSITTI